MSRFRHAAALALLLAAAPVAAQEPSASSEQVRIRVSAEEPVGEMTPFWAWIGYDEPNYTYMPHGLRLLDDLAEASPVPVHFRAHNLLTTGEGTFGLKWGSTNAYTEDAGGRPVYDWTIMDRIFDAYVERGLQPFVEIGFMPEALTTYEGPYRHDWEPGDPYGEIYTGWAYPPEDYRKWEELIYRWVRHSVERYGREEVEGWWWEVWNEPDIGYWQGSKEEYFRLYDHAAAGLKRALPTARIGGPNVTSPRGEHTQAYLRDFLEHTLRGRNYATGETGSPLDFVGFHAKGGPRVTDEGHVRMGMDAQLRAIDEAFGIVRSFPELDGIPVIIGESDPEGCAACSVRTNPEYDYRNGTMYSSYLADELARAYQLTDEHGVNLLGHVTWAFQFEGQPWFAGFRSLATNGVPKPVLNVFRMLGKMGTDRRLAVESTGMLPLREVVEGSVRERPDVGALASRDDSTVAVLVWNYHDDDLPAPAADVLLTLEDLPGGRPVLAHYRIDGEHGNAYARWLEMGSPQPPSAAQRAELREASELATLRTPAPVTVIGGKVVLPFSLPRQGVSLVTLTWRDGSSEAR